MVQRIPRMTVGEFRLLESINLFDHKIDALSSIVKNGHGSSPKGVGRAQIHE